MSANESNIRHTLLLYLFKKPRPIHVNEYKLATRSLFPGKETFIEFLLTDDSQERINLAREIITRLCFERKVSPPTHLLENLLSFEDKQRNSHFTEGDFIPRDHFVHLVNLYLLGIYIFSYHRTLHTKCTSHLNNIKRSVLRKKEVPHVAKEHEYNSYELFGTMWSYFVLYHDLGYPWERILPEERNSEKPYLKPFTKIYKSLLKDFAFRIISRLIVLKSMFEENINTTFKDMYEGKYDFLENSILKENVVSIKVIEDAVFVPSLDGFSNLKTAFSFYDYGKIFAVLEDSSTGNPIIMIRRNSMGQVSSQKFITPKDIKLSNYRDDKLAYLAFHECSFPIETYEWKYFIFEPDIDSFVKLMFEDKYDSFKNIKNRICGNEEYIRLKLSKIDNASDLEYYSFRQLQKIIGYSVDPDDDKVNYRKVSDHYEKKYSDLTNKLPKFLSETILSVLSDEIKAGTFKPKDIFVKFSGIDRINETVNHLSDKQTKSKIVQKLDTLISPWIDGSIILFKAVKDCQQHLREYIVDRQFEKDNLNKLFGSIVIGSKTSKQRIDKDTDLSALKLKDLFALDNTDYEYFNKIVIKSGFKNGVSHLINKYFPSWALDQIPDKKKYVDHGVAASIIVISNYIFYKQLIAKLNEENNAQNVSDKLKLKIALEIQSDPIIKMIEVENELLIREVMPAVLLHNISPKDFDDPEARKYRTDPTTQPFMFISLLADGLQKWDRLYLAKQSTTDINNILPGSRFDLKIDGGYLKVYLKQKTLNFENEEKNLRNSLSEYLKSANLFIHLNMNEHNI